MEQTEFQVEVAPGIVRRRDRGLCIKGHRMSLYFIMDFLKAGWPPHLLRDQLLLTEEEMQNAVNYIEANREAFEAEYAEVVQHCAERERYYRARQEERRKRLAEERPGPPPNLSPEQAAVWAGLMARRKQREQERHEQEQRERGRAA